MVMRNQFLRRSGSGFTIPEFPGGAFPGNPPLPNPQRPIIFDPPTGIPKPGGGRPAFPFLGGGGTEEGPLGDPDFLKNLLGEEPRLSFFSQVNRLGGTGTPQGRFFNTQFENFQNEFFGRLGGQIQGGQFPSQTFDEFLGGIDFNRRFRSLAPSLRGQGGQARFRPPTQFLF